MRQIETGIHVIQFMTIKMTHPTQRNILQVKHDRFLLYFDRKLDLVSRYRENETKNSTLRKLRSHRSAFVQLNPLHLMSYRFQAIDHSTNCILNSETWSKPLYLEYFLK